MKNNAKYLLLLIFLAVISFIVWDKSQSTSLNKVQYSLIYDKNMAEMAIISQKDNFSLDKIEEITKNYHPTYIKKNYNTWEAETKTIYFYSKTANTHQKKLLDYLKHQTAKENWTMAAGGDIMLARHVGKKMLEASNWNLPFLKIKNLFYSADVAFANLESPFAEGGQKIFEGMVFGADPKAVSGLKYAGFDVLSLANNHFGNQGKKGMNYTMDFLTENQINYSGAGTNLTKARRPTLIDVNGSKIAFLSYEGVDSTPQNYVADATSSGFAKWNLNTLALDIKNAKNEKAEFIIVSMHAGTEYKYLPRDDQKDFARKTIDLGADLVIGHHPHRIQTFENYHGKMIFYSLGNLVFDQMWSEQTKQGMVIKFEFVSNQIKSFQIIPVYIENYQQPRFCSQNEAEQ